MALIQVNYLSQALFRTVTLNVILPADKINYESPDAGLGSGNVNLQE